MKKIFCVFILSILVLSLTSCSLVKKTDVVGDVLQFYKTGKDISTYKMPKDVGSNEKYAAEFIRWSQVLQQEYKSKDREDMKSPPKRYFLSSEIKPYQEKYQKIDPKYRTGDFEQIFTKTLGMLKECKSQCLEDANAYNPVNAPKSFSYYAKRAKRYNGDFAYHLRLPGQRLIQGTYRNGTAFATMHIRTDSLKDILEATRPCTSYILDDTIHMVVNYDRGTSVYVYNKNKNIMDVFPITPDGLVEFKKIAYRHSKEDITNISYNAITKVTFGDHHPDMVMRTE